MTKRPTPKRKRPQRTARPVATTESNPLAGSYILRVLAIVTLSSILLVSGGLFAYGQTLSDRIRPGVWVADIDLGGRTLVEAQYALTERILAYEQGGARFSAGAKKALRSLGDLGLRIDVSATVVAAFSVGRSNTFTEQFALPSLGGRTNVPLVVRVDAPMLEAAHQDLQSALGTTVVEPSVTLEDGVAVTRPGIAGVSVVMENFDATLLQDVALLQPLAYTFPTVAAAPRISEADLTSAASQLERMASRPLTLEYGAKRYVVQPADLAQWVTYSYDEVAGAQAPLSGITLGLNTPVVNAYLDQRNDEIGKKATATFGYHAQEEGEYAYKNQMGRAIDVATTSKDILAALKGQDDPHAALTVQDVFPEVEYLTVQSPKPTGKVIAVDLTRQVVFAFEDGKLIYWTRTSTGRPGYDTPTGEWKVYAKTRRQVMSGPDYYLPNVQWVLPYNGDYTLHGTYWHTNFGHPMSHGCSNLSNTDAEWVYTWAEIGTPVVIYKS